MRIHPEGATSIAFVGIGLLSFNLIMVALLPQNMFFAMLPVAVLSLCVWLFFIQFFRNPVRHIPDCKNCVLSPADGTIVAIEQVMENEFFHSERLKVSIYMSALNVHVNRIPIDGEVIYTRYHPGKYLVAFHPKASELNERNTVVMEDTAGHRLLVRQIAGILARRIVCYAQVNQTLSKGEELGFIKFGSRCDVFLPLESKVNVKLQQKVTGGETILAEL